MGAALLLIIPALFIAAVLIAGGKHSKNIALTGSLLTLALTLYLFTQFYLGLNPGTVAAASFSLNVPWVPAWGINFNIGIDGISMVLVLLTGILYPFIIASSGLTSLDNRRHESLSHSKAFYSLMLLMQLGLFGVFMARDAFLFYVFYELTLIPVYFICAVWGGERSIPITLKFFIYTLAGSLFMLVAIIYLYFKTPVATPST
jgi:NADH-quinone oxidoreductase subunit M